MTTERRAVEMAQFEKMLDLERDVERLTRERDRAREECGHEKAMRASHREEMMRYLTDMRAAEEKVARVLSLLETCPHFVDSGRVRAALDGLK